MEVIIIAFIDGIAWFYGLWASLVPKNPLWIIPYWILFVYFHYRLLGVIGGLVYGFKYWVFDDMSSEGFKYGFENGDKIMRVLFFGWAVYGSIFR